MICGGIYAKVYCILVRVQCHRKESSRSLSHLLMSFLLAIYYLCDIRTRTPSEAVKAVAALHQGAPGQMKKIQRHG